MNKKLEEEVLALVSKAKGGKLLPEHLLAWARGNPDSELGKQFNWDMFAAAREYARGNPTAEPPAEWKLDVLEAARLHWIDQAHWIIASVVGGLCPNTSRGDDE